MKCTSIQHQRTSITGGSFQPKGCWVNWNIGSGSDEREMMVTSERRKKSLPDFEKNKYFSLFP